MKKPWFGPKEVGWGWKPVSWEGWLATAVCVLAVIGVHRIHVFGPDATFWASAAILVAFIGLIFLTTS